MKHTDEQHAWGKALKDPFVKSAFDRRFLVAEIEEQGNPYSMDLTGDEENNKLLAALRGQMKASRDTYQAKRAD